MSADNDCLAAVKARWDADAILPALVSAKLQAGRLKSPQTLPYAHVMSEQGPRPNEYQIPAVTGGTYVDYRRVTLTARGLKADVDAILDRVVVVFDWKLFTVPNAALLHCMPLGAPMLAEDPATKEGSDIWVGTAAYELMTQRIVP